MKLKKIRLSVIGLIIANVLAIGMTLSFYFIGRRVSPEYRSEFSQIVKLQEAGHLREAIGQYQELIEQYGIDSCNLYYNIGNAYYRLDRYGRALQYYEKARKLKPGKRDVRSNIRHVEKKLNVDNRDLRRRRGFLHKQFFRLLDFYSIYGWTIFTIANYWRFCIGIMLLIFFGAKRKFFVYLALVLGIIFVLGLGLTGTRAWIDMTTREGVVLESELSAKYEHDEEGQSAFTVREGMVVRILSEWRDWYEIRLNTGSRGWVKRSVIGDI